jgi:Putative prokaryotic signal transducing protein
MREVSVHRDPAIVGYHKSILEGAGIPCFIRNEHTSASLGAGFLDLVQSQVFDPVLCVMDDDLYDAAVELLRGSIAAVTLDQADWSCGVCHEIVPGNFAACWNCPESVGDGETAAPSFGDTETTPGDSDTSSHSDIANADGDAD